MRSFCSLCNGITTLFTTKKMSEQLPPLISACGLLDPQTEQILSCIQPNRESHKLRSAISRFIQNLVSRVDVEGTFAIGSGPLVTYLPDSDIDIGALVPPSKVWRFFKRLTSILQAEASKRQVKKGFVIHGVNFVNGAGVRIVKCKVGKLLVDISSNTVGALGSACFLEEVAGKIGQKDLFKRSVLLIKAWCLYEARLVASHHSLLSSYAVEVMVLAIVNNFHAHLCGPLSVLATFLKIYSVFDFGACCLTIRGPVRIRELLAGQQAVLSRSDETVGREGGGTERVKNAAGGMKEVGAASESPVSDSGLWGRVPDGITRRLALDQPFLDRCRAAYMVGGACISGPGRPHAKKRREEPASAAAAQSPFADAAVADAAPAGVRRARPVSGLPRRQQGFAPKHLNLLDPMDPFNNLGRSVSLANLLRIRKALAKGASELTSLLRAALPSPPPTTFPISNSSNGKQQRLGGSKGLANDPSAVAAAGTALARDDLAFWEPFFLPPGSSQNASASASAQSERRPIPQAQEGATKAPAPAAKLLHFFRCTVKRYLSHQGGHRVVSSSPAPSADLTDLVASFEASRTVWLKILRDKKTAEAVAKPKGDEKKEKEKAGKLEEAPKTQPKCWAQVATGSASSKNKNLSASKRVNQSSASKSHSAGERKHRKGSGLSQKTPSPRLPSRVTAQLKGAWKEGFPTLAITTGSHKPRNTDTTIAKEKNRKPTKEAGSHHDHRNGRSYASKNNDIG